MHSIIGDNVLSSKKGGGHYRDCVSIGSNISSIINPNHRSINETAEYDDNTFDSSRIIRGSEA
jgi:hypothetical protein